MDVNASFYANNSSCCLAGLFCDDLSRAASTSSDIRNTRERLYLLEVLERYGRKFLRLFQGQVEIRLTWRYMLADYNSNLADYERMAPLEKAEIEKIITKMQDRFPGFESPGVSDRVPRTVEADDAKSEEFLETISRKTDHRILKTVSI
ncbi:hypothetical protein BHYA_0338g00080 [Botrytis hyacinthi]|uniref:Uncharacterized protein n=1 Tax=Botrytis hyacinthi TaxID=278943 RepID=A0A4Z1G5K2_9HELO|nr:hypothetical protein BHYA_0338g00080 [Botrytis hyacinthi]